MARRRSSGAWRLAATVALAAWVGGPPPAIAGGPLTVVVLPYATEHEELAVYAKPVAVMIARRLGEHPGFSVRAAGVEEEAPRADLVVQLRATVGRKRVRLEAQLRDPAVGDVLAAVSSPPVGLARIDGAALRVAGDLDAHLEPAARSLGERTERARAPGAGAAFARSGGGAVVAAGEAGRAEPAAEARPAGHAPGAPSGRAARPRVVVYQAEGQAAAGAVEVRAVATGAALEHLGRLGLEPVVVTGRGLAPPGTASRDARAHAARATLMVNVQDVVFDWRGVLAARGRVRLVLVDVSGAIRLDRLIQTDTVVGSRGDRHDALVRFAVRQALEIATPDLRRVLR